MARLEFIGSKNILDAEEKPDIDPQKLEGVETKEYLQQVNDLKRQFKPVESGAGENVSLNTRNYLIDNQMKQIVLSTDFYQKFSREPIVFFKNMGYADH